MIGDGGSVIGGFGEGGWGLLGGEGGCVVTGGAPEPVNVVVTRLLPVPPPPPPQPAASNNKAGITIVGRLKDQGRSMLKALWSELTTQGNWKDIACSPIEFLSPLRAGNAGNPIRGTVLLSGSSERKLRERPPGRRSVHAESLVLGQDQIRWLWTRCDAGIAGAWRQGNRVAKHSTLRPIA